MKLFFALVLCTASLLAPAGTPVASGKIILPKGASAKAKGLRTLFISVQDAKAASPMPCAAQKFTLDKDAQGEFLAFKLDTDSLTMMGCPELPETMNLKVKLDKDGSAGPDTSGDIVGNAKGVKKGATNLKITLDKTI